MIDNTLQHVMPALSLGLSVQNDETGRLRFWNNDIEIVYRYGKWVTINSLEPNEYHDDIFDALKAQKDK